MASKTPAALLALLRCLRPHQRLQVGVDRRRGDHKTRAWIGAKRKPVSQECGVNTVGLREACEEIAAVAAMNKDIISVGDDYRDWPKSLWGTDDHAKDAALGAVTSTAIRRTHYVTAYPQSGGLPAVRRRRAG